MDKEEEVVVFSPDSGDGVGVKSVYSAYRENSRGLKTQPCGAPMIRMRINEWESAGQEVTIPHAVMCLAPDH